MSLHVFNRRYYGIGNYCISHGMVWKAQKLDPRLNIPDPRDENVIMPCQSKTKTLTWQLDPSFSAFLTILARDSPEMTSQTISERQDKFTDQNPVKMGLKLTKRDDCNPSYRNALDWRIFLTLFGVFSDCRPVDGPEMT